MLFAVGQLYLKPDVAFPFTHVMQRYLGDRVSALVPESPAFISRFGANWTLIVRVSADDEISDNKILGPTVFKTERDVEFSLFLPYNIIVSQRGDVFRAALHWILSGIAEILDRVGLDPRPLVQANDSILDEMCSRPEMIKTEEGTR